jgi:hypothetical protein
MMPRNARTVMKRWWMLVIGSLVAVTTACGNTTGDKPDPSACKDEWRPCYNSFEELDLDGDLSLEGSVDPDGTEDISGSFELVAEDTELHLRIRCTWDGSEPHPCMDATRDFSNDQPSSPIIVDGYPRLTSDSSLHPTAGVVTVEMAPVSSQDSSDEYDVVVTVEGLIVEDPRVHEAFVVMTGRYEERMVLTDEFVNYDG